MNSANSSYIYTASYISDQDPVNAENPTLFTVYKTGSSSIKNFAARLKLKNNAEIFTSKERVERNVNGIGKPKHML